MQVHLCHKGYHAKYVAISDPKSRSQEFYVTLMYLGALYLKHVGTTYSENNYRNDLLPYY